MIEAKKNTAYYLSFPAIDSASPASYATGISPVDIAYYKDGAGAWTSLAITDTATEIGTTGVYEIDLTAAEMNHDKIIIKFAVSGMADDAYQFDLRVKLTDDLQDISTTQVNTECDTALTDYDGPTNAELNARTILAANYFDPATDTVANVTTVATLAGHTPQTGDSYLGATAHAAIQDQYDGTGLTGDTYPSTQAQVGNISTGSAAISTVADSGVVTTGENVTNSYTDTFTLNGVYHTIDEVDATGNFDVEYTFTVGGTGVAVEVVMTGYLAGNGDELAVEAWNYVSSAWDQIGTLIAGSATPGESRFNLLIAHTGTSGAELGEVKVRGYENTGGLSNVTLAMDQVFISYAIVSQSVGYANGAIWVDTVSGIAGTEAYVNGVADNPVSTWADALTLSSQVGLTRFELSSDSSITLTANSDNYQIFGVGALVALNSQSIAGAIFHGPIISGIGTGATRPRFKECSINTVTLPPSAFDRCGFPGPVTVGSAGDFFIIDGFSQVAGASVPIWDMGSSIGASSLSIRRFGGGLSITNIGTGDVISAEATCGGTLTINGTGGDVEARGMWKQITDSSGSAVTIVDKSITLDNINNEADTALTDYAPNTVTPLDASGIRTAIGLVLANLDTQLLAAVTATGFSTHNAVDVRTDMDANSTKLIDILADTNELQLDDIPGLIAALNDISIADILSSQLTESYAADSIAPTLTQVVFLIQQMLGDFSISGTTITTNQLDGVTPAATSTINDAVNPTSRTRAT